MLILFYPISLLGQKLSLKNIRRIIFITLVLSSPSLQAKNYYIASTGNNSANGLTPATAWQTITKVNSFTFEANDYILFRRGDTFYGGINVKRDNLNFGAFGTGANPIITGLSTVTGWVFLGGKIWEAPVPNAKAGVNLVLRNSTIQQVGRYPNADADNGGYLTYTAATNTSITGPALSSTTNWTGAEIVIKGNRWSISRQKVISHSGGVVSFTTNADVPRLNYGYFFQRDSRTLDKDGEWWHNVSSNKLRMYFSSSNPSTYNIQIATIDTLFKCGHYNNLSISDLSFYGSGRNSIWIYGGNFVTIRNCTINNSGTEAITVKTSLNVTVDNCTATNSLGSGINVNNPNGGTVNFLVQNCTVSNTALIAGMEASNEGNGGEGINCIGGDGVRVFKNSITNSGYNGIRWQGNNVYIKYNLIDRFCLHRDDGAGIYSWETAEGRLVTRTNRNIVSNIVVNGIGSHDGTNNESTSAQGLYFDTGTKNVMVDSNTVAYIANGAFQGNNCGSLTFTNNVFFGTERSSSLQRFAGAELIRNIVMNKNILYPYRFRYINLGINLPATTKETDIPTMGTFDKNYYSIETGTDRSLATITTNADGTDFKEEYFESSYLTGIVGIEKNSTKVQNTGTLEYNAGSSPKQVPFPGLSKKDVFGNVFNNSVTIPAWSSKVLIPNGMATTANKPPVANAGASLTIKLPVITASLTGYGTDPDGTISKYSWAKISGPSSGIIVSPIGATTLLLNLATGIYQYELTVTDDDGSTGKDTVQVTVNPLIGDILLPDVNPANTVNGLDYKYYEGTWLELPLFTTLTPVKTGTVSGFDLNPADIPENYGFSFNGYINVPSDGMYTFYTYSDDGSNLLIDNVLVVSNDGLHGPIEKSGVIGLEAGKHAIKGLYFQKGGGAVFFASYQGNGISKRAIPSSALYRVNPSPPPAARIANGMMVAPVNKVNTSELKISSFPNPSVTEFTLLVAGGTNEKIDISAMSANGSVVFRTTGTTNKTYRFGYKFIPGVYLIKVVQGSKIQTIKLVKN